MQFFCALAFFQPQNFVLVEQFGAENISVVSRRLVIVSPYQLRNLKFILPKLTLFYYDSTKQPHKDTN